MRLEKNNENPIDDKKIVNQIRSLGIDMIREASSGHPGIVLGAAPMIYALYANHMRIDPENPELYNRDRFVLSAGHGSALLYATLFMAGYPIELEDLKNFRQIDSITPGHPEAHLTPGVDMTTGPLGQGIATAVGIAMGERHLASRYNQGKKELIDFHTYVLCGDGDLMEGISYEAISLAGSLKLNKLIVLYDNNDICLDGKTEGVFDDDIEPRFTSSGWNVITVEDGENTEEISRAINDAKTLSDKPTLISVKTTIGKFSKLQGTNKVHGAALDPEDILEIKKKMGVREIPFMISSDTMEDFQFLINQRCRKISQTFDKTLTDMDVELQKEIEYLIGTDKQLDVKELYYTPGEKLKESPRETSEKVLNSFVKDSPFILNGSADLFGACKNYIEGAGDFSAKDYSGKNIFFGVREHAMGAILNGISLLGYRPIGSTFLSFYDYLKPSMRLSCMMNLPVTYIFTHDSISVGEDGATHQPVEQLHHLRTTPNLEVFRPSDANEVLGTYKTILQKNGGPSSIILSRNELPISPFTSANEISNGGYIVRDSERIDGILISSGEELHLSLEVAERLAVKGISLRVVSMPCLKRFLDKDEEYKEQILPIGIRKIVIEASSAYSWYPVVFNPNYLITLDEYGCSGKKDDVYKKYGFDIDTLEEKVEKLLN